MSQTLADFPAAFPPCGDVMQFRAEGGGLGLSSVEIHYRSFIAHRTTALSEHTEGGLVTFSFYNLKLKAHFKNTFNYIMIVKLLSDIFFSF